MPSAARASLVAEELHVHPCVQFEGKEPQLCYVHILCIYTRGHIGPGTIIMYRAQWPLRCTMYNMRKYADVYITHACASYNVYLTHVVD